MLDTTGQCLTGMAGRRDSEVAAGQKHWSFMNEVCVLGKETSHTWDTQRRWAPMNQGLTLSCQQPRDKKEVMSCYIL